jgi:hypothetical protein
VVFYIAIVLALTLAAAGVVLCLHVVMLEAAGRRQRRRIEELERVNAALREELRRARGEDGGREWWPEVLDEGDGLPLN